MTVRSSRPHTFPRPLALAAALVVALLPATPAAAHTALVSSSPAEGETVTELTEVDLEFTEQLLDIGNEVSLVGPAGTAIALEIVEVTSTLRATVPADALMAGAHELRYRVVSADGHPIDGVVAFTYAPPAPSPTPSATEIAPPSTSPSATATPSPTATPSASASASVTPIAATDDAGSGPGAWVWILGAVAAAGALTAVVVAARRPRTS